MEPLVLSNHVDKQIKFAKKETFLLSLIKKGEYEYFFDLGQLYFENEKYENAKNMFENGCSHDLQSKYQLATFHWCGLGGQTDRSTGLDLMKQVAESDSCKDFKKVQAIRAAQYNVGLAYLYGVGVDSDPEEAIKFFKMSADEGSPQGCRLAQTALGFLYSDLKHDSLNLRKAFECHSDACGQGSLESQGILGAMYLFGFGIPANLEKAMICLREASSRGSLFARGLLIMCYFQHGLNHSALKLGEEIYKIQEDSLAHLSSETECCVPLIKRGICFGAFSMARYHQKCGDESLVRNYYSKAIRMDPDLSIMLYRASQFGYI